MKINRSAFATTVALGLLVLIQAPRLEAAIPTVTTVAATNVTASSATLRGSINPRGTTTTVWFEWGPGDAIRHQTTPTSIGSGSSTVNTNAAISGLTSGLTYRYRAVGSNSFGVIRGRSLPFGVPTVVLNGASVQTNAMFAPYVELGAVVFENPPAITAGLFHTLALKADGTVVGWGTYNNGTSAANIGANVTNIVAIAAGNDHSLALTKGGTVLGWGSDSNGQINIPTTATNIVAIAAGGRHSLALKADGTVIAWGDNAEGQTNVSTDATNVIAISAGDFHSLALRANGTVAAWGALFEDYDQAKVPVGLKNVVAIAAGGKFSMVLRADRTIFKWGGNGDERSEWPAEGTNMVSITAGYYHALGLRADQSVMSWGDNVDGQSSAPPEVTNNVITITAGLAHSLASKADGAIVAWGLQTNAPSGLDVPNLPVTITGTVNTSTTNASVLLYSATNVFGYTATTSRTVQIRALRIGSISRLGNGNLWLTASFVPGKTIEVLTATNFTLPMASWTGLGYASEPTAGNYTFTNSHPLPQQFYRLRLVD